MLDGSVRLLVHMNPAHHRESPKEDINRESNGSYSCSSSTNRCVGVRVSNAHSYRWWTICEGRPRKTKMSRLVSHAVESAAFPNDRMGVRALGGQELRASWVGHLSTAFGNSHFPSFPNFSYSVYISHVPRHYSHLCSPFSLPFPVQSLSKL